MRFTPSVKSHLGINHLLNYNAGLVASNTPCQHLHHQQTSSPFHSALSILTRRANLLPFSIQMCLLFLPYLHPTPYINLILLLTQIHLNNVRLYLVLIFTGPCMLALCMNEK